MKEDDDAHEWVDYFNGLVRENEMNEGVQNKDIDIGFLLLDDWYLNIIHFFIINSYIITVIIQFSNKNK